MREDKTIVIFSGEQRTNSRVGVYAMSGLSSNRSVADWEIGEA